MISLIAFLGNYGREYERTRHNVAWQFASSLPFYNAFSWQEKFKGDVAVLETAHFAELCAQTGLLTTKDGGVPPVPKAAPEKLYFLKPLTYMNLSGESIGELARFYKIAPEEVLVVHDELELPLGTLSLKWSGGLGGHNGLRSTKAVLGTADFWRLRFGLTKPVNRDIADYVLSAFTADEQPALQAVFGEGAKLFAKLLLSSDPARLIPEWGKKKVLV
ncbi:MAG: aminoacyl-tRNA hydrolase [Treponema sp.]|nr:aminoacyl-tRNA hydrolase [Treponema sp.]